MDFVVTNYKYFHPANFGIGFMYQWTKTSSLFMKVTHKKNLKTTIQTLLLQPKNIDLLWNGMIPLHEKIHFIFSMTEIKCKLVKFNKCYVKRILLFIVIDLNRKKWWSIDEVSTVWMELFTCSYSMYCRDNNSVYHLKIMNGTSRSIYNICLFIIHVAAKMRKYFLYC